MAGTRRGFHQRGLLDAVLRPSDYTDAERFARERERLFRPGFLFACTWDEVARPGDHVARDVLGVPVVVRNCAGELRAFRNVCPHRHALVVPPGRGRSERLRCQVHGWEFRDDGRVARIPDGASFRGMRADGLCLGALRVERLGALVFVSLTPSGETLRDALGDLAPEIDAFFGRRRLMLRATVECTANWKTIVENGTESYHVTAVHPGMFLRRGLPDEDLHDHRLERGYTRYLDVGTWGAHPLERVVRALCRLTLPRPTYQRFVQAHVFPNVLLYYTELFSTFRDLEPLDAGRTRITLLGFVPEEVRRPWLARPLQALTNPVWRTWIRRALRQDLAVCKAVARGLAHSSHPGLLSAREERVHHFQLQVAERLRAPDARSSAAS